MTKAQKKQAEDFIHLLDRAHGGIKKTIETGNNEAALDLLSQCQECAIKLGEIIEEIEEKTLSRFRSSRIIANWYTSSMRSLGRISRSMGIKRIKRSVNP